MTAIQQQQTLAGIDRYTVAPFTVVIDSREQAPFSFKGFTADGGGRGKPPLPLVVPITVAALATGDYSIAGHEAEIAVERKSKSDLFQTFISDRERGIAQLERLAALPWAAIVVEADIGAVINGPDHLPAGDPLRVRQGKSLYRSWLAWEQRYPTVHWHFLPTRTLAERTCYRVLERWWKDRQQKQEHAT